MYTVSLLKGVIMKKLSRNQETVINLASNLLSMLITLAMNFCLTPYIVKHLGEEANGFTQLANNFVTYAALIAATLNFMGARFMSIEYHKGEGERVNEYYSSLTIGNYIIIFVLAIAGFFCVSNIDSLVRIENANVNDVKILFAFVFGSYFLTLIQSLFSTSLFIKNKLIYTNLINICTHVLRFALVMTLFLTLDKHIYYVSLVDFFLAILSVFAHMALKRRLLPEVRFSFSMFRLEYVKKLVISGIWDTVSQLGNLLMTGLDLLLANLFISPAEMGVLSIAKIIPNNIMRVGKLINRNFSPNLTILYAKEGKESVVKNLRWAIRLSSAIVSVPVGVLFVYGEAFFQLWVPSMDAEKLGILSLLSCMSLVFLSGTHVLYNVFTTTNKLKVNSISVVAGGLVNFVIVYFVLRFTDFGVYAIAGVSCIIWILREMIVTLPYAAHLLDLKWHAFYRDVLISACCFIVISMISYLIQCLLPNAGWLWLIAGVGISCILSLFAEGMILLSKQERRTLLSKLRRKLGKKNA